MSDEERGEASRGLERWRGRVALVTGASSGIGRATALRLGARGLRLAICARRRDRLEALARELEGVTEVLVREADLRREAAVLELFAAVRDRFGGVDVLVNNAGLGRAAPLLSGETEVWRTMLDVNVLALLVCTREAVADMRRRGDDGHVIHVSSLAGHRVPPGGGVYAATKFAVRALTEGLRLELRAAQSGVRVSAISPGFVGTEFFAGYFGDPERAREALSRFRVLDPDDVADAIEWVLARPAHAEAHDVLLRPTRQPT